ncbi:signal recognition particle receptor subunit alpha, partial [Thermogutta sp.]
MGLLDRIKQGLKKTAQILQTDIRDLFKTRGRLVDQAFLDELFEVLVRTDMGVQAAQQLVDQIGQKYRNRVIEWSEAIEEIKKGLKELLRQPESPIRF